MAKKEAFIGLRLPQDELDGIDFHARGQLSRSQVVRAALQDFLAKPEDKQRKILVKRLFGK